MASPFYAKSHNQLSVRVAGVMFFDMKKIGSTSISYVSYSAGVLLLCWASTYSQFHSLHAGQESACFYLYLSGNLAIFIGCLLYDCKIQLIEGRFVHISYCIFKSLILFVVTNFVVLIIANALWA